MGIRRNIILKVLRKFLLCLPVVSVGMICLSSCAPMKGPMVLNTLPSPILTPHIAKTIDLHNFSNTPVQSVNNTPAQNITPSPAYFSGITNVPAEWFSPVTSNDWQVIVVHHSASDTGGSQTFDIAHRARGWDELGYHFVIGNGTDTPDGYVEVGSRWKKQKHGAHCKTPSNFYNDYGIGICLVGNFDETSPTPRQMQSLRRLVAFLSQRYHITSERIYGHGEVKGTHTRCPGRYFPTSTIRYNVNSNAPLWASSTR
jgi:N-acetyl-anhydromuramyl-L-alanine amidase AmpD